jgi:hypothetical protein
MSFTNVKVLTSVLDKSLTKDKYSDCYIIASVNEFHLRLLYFSPLENKVLGFEKIHFDSLNQRFDFLKEKEALNFKQLRFVLTPEKFTLVPKAFFQPGDGVKYLNFNSPLTKNEKVRFETLLNDTLVNIYAIDSSFFAQLDALVKYKITALNSALIEYAASLNEQQVICVHLLKDKFFITICQDKKLQFQNIFNYTTVEDFIYYLLFSLDQLEIDNQKACIHLSGAIDKTSILYATLLAYVHQVKLVNELEKFSFSNVFNDFPKQHIMDLLFVLKCE